MPDQQKRITIRKTTAMLSWLIRALLFCSLWIVFFCCIGIQPGLNNRHRFHVWRERCCFVRYCLFPVASLVFNPIRITSTAFTFGERIVALFLTTCSFLLHWHSTWFYPSMKHPEVVFGRAREGAFDAKASSRKYSSTFSHPLQLSWRGAGNRSLATKNGSPQLFPPYPVIGYPYSGS